MKETLPKMGANNPKGISNRKSYKMGAVEYTNKHRSAHSKTESQGVITYGTHKACK